MDLVFFEGTLTFERPLAQYTLLYELIQDSSEFVKNR